MEALYLLLHGLGVVPLTSLINKFLGGEWTLFGVSSKQLVSWATAAVVGFLASNLHWGVIGEGEWYVVLAKSLMAGLVANGIYKVGFIAKLLEFLKLKPVE